MLTSVKAKCYRKCGRWISSYLEKYFLSDKFNDVPSLERIYDKQKMPLQFRQSEKPVYAVNLTATVYNYWMLVIQFLNSLSQHIKWDVPTAIKRYQKYVKDLSNKEQTETILDSSIDSSYEWVKLKDKCALDRESALMQHCTSRNDTPHLEHLLEGKYIFLSLRKNNKPHVTLKYNPRSMIIIDLVGKQNRTPQKKYYPFVLEVMNYLGLNPQNENILPFKDFEFNHILNEWEIK